MPFAEMWMDLDWCFWTMVLEKTLESFLDYKEIKPVHPKGNQSWIMIGSTDVEAEALVLWPPDAKNWLTGKDPDAGKDWRQEKGMTEDEMVRWHHWLKGHELEHALRDNEGQGSLACCSPWGHKQSDVTEQLNWTEMLAGKPGSLLLPPVSADSGFTWGSWRFDDTGSSSCSLQQVHLTDLLQVPGPPREFPGGVSG